jgi:hypothetical protein
MISMLCNLSSMIIQMAIVVIGLQQHDYVLVVASIIIMFLNLVAIFGEYVRHKAE